MYRTSIDVTADVTLAQKPHVHADSRNCAVSIFADGSEVRLTGDPDTVIEWLREAADMVEARRVRPAVA